VSDTGLTCDQLEQICAIFRRVSAIREVLLFGSRAKGTHRPSSDIDLALIGIHDELKAESIAEQLELLPLPYRFDVKAYDGIRYLPLREHINRVGVSIYRREDAD
jgi:predicted nucleotidyltransferase